MKSPHTHVLVWHLCAADSIAAVQVPHMALRERRTSKATWHCRDGFYANFTMAVQGQGCKQHRQPEMRYPGLTSCASWWSDESAILTFCMRWVSIRSRQAPVAALQALNTISPYACNTDLRPETIWFRMTAVSSYTILGCKTINIVAVKLGNHNGKKCLMIII